MLKYTTALALLLSQPSSFAAASEKSGVTVTSAPATATTKTATAIFVNGRIPSAGKKATALAVSADRILAIGTDAEIGKLTTPDTVAVDLKGKTLIPGLTDAHAHLFSLGHEKSQLDLSKAVDENDAALIVGRKVAGVAKGTWIVGNAWDQNKWPSKKMPTLDTLDKVASENPVVLYRIDGHAAWVNSRALKLAGMNSTTPEPEGGKILRDDKGFPSGVLLDRAMRPVYALIPEPTIEEREAAMRAAFLEALSYGLTTVHDMSVTREGLEIFLKLAKAGELPLRISAYLAGSDQELVNQWLSTGPMIGAYDNHLTVRGFKMFADGALGSRGASLLEPYSDDPKTAGALRITTEELTLFTRRALKSGFQVATHAIGDRGNRVVLDAYEAALKGYPVFSSPRLRIEHAQILHPDEVPRFKKLGVVASMQPTHCTSDMPWVPERLGAKRTESEAYVWRALLKSGARIASGSDAPVESINPFPGIYSAVARAKPDGTPKGGWNPAQKMTFGEALDSFTKGAAYATFEEDLKGSLEVGKLADFVALEEKVDELPPAKISDVRPALTVVGGKVVYDARLNSK